MTQPIQQHRLAATGKRRHYGKIRHVSRRKQQRPLAPGESSKLLFQARVLRPMPGHEMRSAASRPTALRAFAHRCGNRGMASEPQIIIAGKVDELPPVNDCGYPTARLNKRSIVRR